MKKVIGIAPASALTPSDGSRMSDFYKLGDTYISRVVDSGCIPFGLAPSDNWLTKEALDMCDGFLVQGGEEFYPYHFQIIHHAITRNKRYLGICLGNQLIYAYLKLKKAVEKIGYSGDIVKAICDFRASHASEASVLEKIDGHYSTLPQKGCESDAKHTVNIVPGTHLHRILKRDALSIATFHRYCIPRWQDLVAVSAWSSDDEPCIEGIEYGNNVIGVQGHPEIDDQLPELFDFLAGKE